MERIDRYRVVRKIGTGTMGDVYEAEHMELGTRVALKLLHEQHQGSEAAARFLREGKTLGLFRHRNIVEMLEVGRAEDGTLFLATELVRGISLRDLVRDGLVEPRRALTIVRQVVDALGAAHAVGVIHRDVKPDNIMLADGGTEDGTDLVKVLDFGVAKLMTDTASLLGEANLTQAGMSVFGSPDYIAPEVVLGQPVDARADLYSAGVVLYELLTGKPPFDASEPVALMRLATTAPIPTLAERAPGHTFAPELEQLVADALAKSPDLRFRSAAEMVAAIDAAMRGMAMPSTLSEVPVVTAPLSSAPSAPVPAFTAPIPASAPIPAFAAAGRVALPGLPPDAPMPPPPARSTARGGLVDSILAFVRAHKMPVAAAAGALLFIVVLAVALSGDDKAASGPKPKQSAADLLSLGHARFEAGRRLDGLAAYELALRASSSSANDGTLRANTQKAIDGKDAVDAVVALEIAARADQDALIKAASSAKNGDVRRRAFAIAEREGIDAKIDRVDSWSLDLQQATTCDDRKLAIEKLADTGDKRAVAALKRAKSHKCVEREAAEAIAKLEGS